jgi:hypothetical protein
MVEGSEVVRRGRLAGIGLPRASPRGGPFTVCAGSVRGMLGRSLAVGFGSRHGAPAVRRWPCDGSRGGGPGGGWRV